MKAAFINATGSPDIIEFGDVPDPQLRPDQVLIRVEASSVNPIDTYVRGGVIAMELPTPYFPGCDAAGVVEAVGSAVKRFAVGDRVWTTNQGLLGRQGTFAEQIAVDEKWVYALPREVSFEDAAACALVGVTAHLGLFREAALEPGETVLVIGGSGGVGSLVVQMAAAHGARVIATAGSKEKADKVRSFGAEEVILYKDQSIPEQVQRFAPQGVNVLWETRREPDFASAVGMLAERGRMVLMAGRDAQPPFPVGPFYVKECSLHGFVMFKATPIEMRTAAEDLTRMLKSGKIRANIGARFPLDQAAAAHRLQESATLGDSDQLCGKVVVINSESSVS
ncbi:NADPH:quinone reductase [Allorhodopirellula heiligendammensis]|uniref:Quinone oxidoreductase 1 n=1 Tax=Allorhodopirellula heiligendammensis TaxID=2714739 RepID=A0A5C6BYE4_9BACT|nr:NADPH:quinone reductase [Allorhodopirellula heiligendammensis]TWU16955.1 Quinone oxidoreductase 1 [Allorhodopirellula heiligendammensis]